MKYLFFVWLLASATSAQVTVCASDCERCVTCELPRGAEVKRGTNPVYWGHDGEAYAFCGVSWVDRSDDLHTNTRAMLCMESHGAPPEWTGDVTACAQECDECVTCHAWQGAHCKRYESDGEAGCACMLLLSDHTETWSESVICDGGRGHQRN